MPAAEGVGQYRPNCAPAVASFDDIASSH
jgi:hypothetical protein